MDDPSSNPGEAEEKCFDLGMGNKIYFIFVVFSD